MCLFELQNAKLESLGRNPMHQSEPTNADLIAYQDEMLPSERMSLIENELRQSEALRQRLAQLIQERESSVHSVGEIWRRGRLSCPTRSQLGSFLLRALDADAEDYVEFHIQTVGCRYCEANLADLEQSREATDETHQRRRKFYQTSAGNLPKSTG